MGSRCMYCAEWMQWWGRTCDKCKEKIAIQNKQLQKDNWRERMKKLNQKVRSKK